MHPFKEGDKVVVVDPADPKLIEGAVHVIKRVYGTRVDLEDPLGINMNYWFANRFKLYEEPKNGAIVPGSRVRCTHALGLHQDVGVVEGGIYVVERISASGLYFWVHGVATRASRWKLVDDEAKQVVAKPIVAGDYVVCIDAYNTNTLRAKRRYHVAAVSAKGLLKIAGLWYKASRFEWAEPEEAKPAQPPVKKQEAPPSSKWAEGDWVRVVGADYYGNTDFTKANKDKPLQITETPGLNYCYVGGKVFYFKDLEYIIPQPPQPPIVELRQALVKEMRANMGTVTCAFAFELANGRQKYHSNAPCHAQLSNNYQGITKLAYCIQTDQKKAVKCGAKPEHYRAYLNYILNDSPWKDCYLHHDADVAIKEDILMNIEKTKYEIAGACLALRNASEFSSRLKLFNRLLEDGHNPHTCWLFACGLEGKDNRYSQTSWNGGHDTMSGDVHLDSVVKFFNEGYHTDYVKKGKPYTHDHGAYLICNAIASTGAGGYSIRKWLADNLKYKVVGNGFHQDHVITYEAVREAATLFDKFFKKEAQ